MNVFGNEQQVPGYLTYIMRDYALQFLEQAPDNKPFFLLYAPHAPHRPATPAPADQDLYKDVPPWRPPNFNPVSMTDKPAWLQAVPQLSPSAISSIDEFRLKQLRSLKAVDESVRDIIEKLSAQGRLENTLIVFYSDNGYFWGEHRLTGKDHVYEEASRVPFAIRYSQLVASPNAAGFDYFCGYTHARNIGTVIEQDKVEANVEEAETQPRLAKKVVEFLNNSAQKEKPFFLYLSLCPPHTPIVPAPQFIGRSGIKGKESQYGDWLYEGDWVLGQALEALDRQKLADNTLIMVSSDNGAAGRTYAPLRGAKTSIYEGGHRVPPSRREDRREVLAVHQVLVHADRAVHLAAAAKEAAQRELQLDGLRILLRDLQEGFDRLVRLLVQQEIEAAEVRQRQRARLAQQVLDVDPRRDPAQREEHRRDRQQPPEVEVDRHARRGVAMGPIQTPSTGRSPRA